MEIPIEDFSQDIIAKAMRGLGIDSRKLAQRCNIAQANLDAVLSGSADAETIRKIAPALGLDAGALLTSARKEWRPNEISVPGLAVFNTPYHDMHVNAFLVWDIGTRKAVAFDTGADLSHMLQTLYNQDLQLSAILLTHTHPDHVVELDSLRSTTGNPPVYVHQLEEFGDANTFDEGQEWTFGALDIHAHHTGGHSIGGVTYKIDGLAQPIAIVGDALFAGSMGGGLVSYSEALRNNREKIFTLPDETVLCPGHGPLTTVAEEKSHNPFFPEFKHID
ncbi:MAG: MBL fold metallo-hydrolase [Verrucomicrobiota bacterium]